MKNISHKVLITTSGTGSRLGALTQDTNKSLLQVNSKEIIRHIIDIYPPETHFVITLGYYGEKVKEVVLKYYPDASIEFINVTLFQGPGSSLGYSMLHAKDVLQCPFVFHCNDTILLDQVPSPKSYNWNAGLPRRQEMSSAQYSTFSVKNGLMTRIHGKRASEFDYYHIGLVGIKDYESFWGHLKAFYDKNPQDTTLNDVPAICAMIEDGIPFQIFTMNHWYDTGNLEGLEKTRLSLG